MEKGMHLSRKANTNTNWFPKIRNNTILICICILTHLTILYISQTTPFLIRHQYSLYKAGSRVYDNGVLSRLLFDGGYVSFRDSVPTYHYYIRDYLGNNRVVADAHGNVEDVNHYYPYGALMGDSRNTGLLPYMYIGKELDRTHGLDWYAHGARHYAP